MLITDAIIFLWVWNETNKAQLVLNVHSWLMAHTAAGFGWFMQFTVFSWENIDPNEMLMLMTMTMVTIPGVRNASHSSNHLHMGME